MQFSLRTVNLIVLLAGIGLGIYLPARESYRRWERVTAIRREVDNSLAVASSLSSESPEIALADLCALRECITRSPDLAPAERTELLIKVVLQSDRTRRCVEQSRRVAARRSSCGIELGLIRIAREGN
jgi:hypothetical protein